MIEVPARTNDAEPAEDVLRAELARGDAAAETVLPILRHLVTNDDSTIFGEEILARVRGMLSHLARHVLDAAAGAAEDGGREHDPGSLRALEQAFIGNPALLSHLHAIALEWQLTERLESRLALDPVTPPLLQELVASPAPEVQSLAMKLLAAQARWCQAQRRMELPLRELPPELLHLAFLASRTLDLEEGTYDGQAAGAEAVRARFEEGVSRLGLASRLITRMSDDAVSALAIGHAGVALFLTALGLRSGQGRDAVALAMHEAQVARLALALRAAGLDPAGIEQQFFALHPDVGLPEGFDRISATRAATILAGGRGTAP
jgi:hypothetical protein